MLSPTLATVRLFLHVLAAAVWVGGQFALGGIVPVLRRVAPDATKPVAQAFARIAWPAFAIVLITGIWNLTEVDITNTDTAYQVTVFVKVLVAVLSGVFAAVHQIGQTRLAMALGGALGAIFALGAVFLGVLLRTGTG